MAIKPNLFSGLSYFECSPENDKGKIIRCRLCPQQVTFYSWCERLKPMTHDLGAQM